MQNFKQKMRPSSDGNQMKGIDMRRLLLATTMLATVSLGITATPVLASDAPPTSAAITNPETVFKAKPGSDYFLANYSQTAAWLQKIAGESDRMKLISIGKTAEGRE